MQLLNLALSGGGQTLNPILKRNLEALSLLSPEVARRIEAAEPAAGVELVESEEGEPGLVADGRTLASRRRPVSEAERLAASVDAGANAAACVLGFGAGYHCRALCGRLGRAGLVLCFEPDVALLRAVLERVDHSAWLGSSRFVLLTEGEDRAAIGRAIEGVEGLIALGVKIVEHPASTARLGASGVAFARTLTQVIGATKTVIATTLAHSGTTLRNLFMNADHYHAADGIAALAGAAGGRAAVVVSAGPSLARNLHLLGEPGVRERVVIVAVQTVLKTMLERGIRPHFVCALDHHEISRRFYEGLTAADVAGVTLVADAKVNPAVLEAWPGALRVTHNDLLEDLVGSARGPKGDLKPGATVAHLCHYLARHLGADPVVLVGQDLGFTDGQYYASGAAIHGVWGGEVGAFNSVEAMEWQRIARGKRTLQRRTDVLGRPIYTDEQMASYLAQFEVDFAADAARGLRVIDATEGGVAKQSTEAMTLVEALERFGAGGELSLSAPARVDLASARSHAAARLGEAQRQATTIARRSGDTVRLLRSMQSMTGPRRVNAAVGRVHAIRDEVTALKPGWRLVTFLNQTGALHRVKADRAIELEAGLSEAQVQQRRIARDADNVEGFIGAAEHLAGLLGRARRAMAGEAPKSTRDEAVVEGGSGRASPGRVEALVLADAGVGGLGVGRDLGAPVAGGSNALCMTVARLLGSRRAAGVTVVTGEPERVRGLLGALAGHERVSIEGVDGAPVRARCVAVGRARLFGASSWRGGLGGLTCYDECFEAATVAAVMARRGLDAALLAGAEWSLVDPALGDSLIERWAEEPGSNRLVFTQAAPGLAPLLIDRDTATRLGGARDSGGVAASIGGLLAYLPHAPQPDPIATRLCVHVDPVVRDLGRRVIADSAPGRARVARAVAALGEGWLEAPAERVARALGSDAADPTPRHLELELCTGRLAGGPWARWVRRSHEPVERPVMSLAAAERIIRQLAESREDAALTLAGVGDPLMHERALDVVAMAREAGIGAVHLRTNLLRDGVAAGSLVASGVGVVSVDVLAGTAQTYRRLTGVDRYEAVVGRVGELLACARGRAEAGLPSPWVVARITRCDEVYEELPDFYDRWVLAGACVQVDPLPSAIPGARIGPLEVPTTALRRRAREHLTVRSDGRCVGPSGRAVAGADLGVAPLAEAWKRVQRVRHEALAPELETAA